MALKFLVSCALLFSAQGDYTNKPTIDAVRGVYPGISTESKFGHNDDVDTGAAEAVWTNGGLWTPQTTARTLSIVSTDADDDDGGNGANTIIIYGVDASRESQTETITLAGLTPVVTTNTWLGVNRMVVATAGSTGYNEGSITATSTTDALVQGQILANAGITEQMIYHTPSGYTAYVTRLLIKVDKISGSDPVVTVRGYRTNPATGVRLQLYLDVLDASGDGKNDVTLQNPVALPGGTYTWFEVTTTQNNTFVRGRMEMTLDEN